jgi:hypothetical protein
MQHRKADLIIELKTIRKGRGIDDEELADRVGPALRSVLAVDETIPLPDLRAAVSDMLTDGADQLPGDLKLALLMAFGLHPDTRQRFYTQRIDVLATALDRNVRTAKRRVDEACRQLADVAMASACRIKVPACEDMAWHTERLRTMVVLDGPGPEIIESRRIVAHHDDVDLIDLAVTITAPPSPSDAGFAVSSDLSVDVLAGGTLVRTAQEATRRLGLSLRLASPLARDEHADFTLRYRIPEGKVTRPHYVCVSRYRCDRFDLSVRFGDDRRPPEEVRLASAFHADIIDPAAVGETVPVDAAGEIHVTFDDLKPGFAYGVRWSGGTVTRP